MSKFCILCVRIVKRQSDVERLSSFRDSQRVCWKEDVCDWTAHTVFLLVKSVQRLCGGDGDLDGVLRELDARLPVEVHEFVDSAERRLRLARHEVRADAVRVDLVPFCVELMQFRLVDVVGCDDNEVPEVLNTAHLSGADELLSALLGEHCEVARVESHADRFVMRLVQRYSDREEVAHARVKCMVRVDQCEEVGREGVCVRYKRDKLALVRALVPEHFLRRFRFSEKVDAVDDRARQLVALVERLDERVRHRSDSLRAKQLSGEDVARRRKPAHQRVQRRRHCAVRPLCAAQAELHQALPLSRGHREARGVGRDEGREVDETKQRRLQELADAHRALNAQQRSTREADGPLLVPVHLDVLGIQVGEIFDEFVVREVRLDVREVVFGEFEVPDELDHLLHSGEHRVLAVERVFPKEKVKRCLAIGAFILPVAVCLQIRAGSRERIKWK